jgi:hypothetical protein
MQQNIKYPQFVKSLRSRQQDVPHFWQSSCHWKRCLTTSP